MRIAIMMRAMDQDSGLHAIIDGLVDAMLRVAPQHTFLLLYRTPKYLGRFAAHGNARELLVTAPHKFLWDQVAVPYHAWRHAADIIYNPKFSVPLISSCPVVMGLQEPAPWAWPSHYEWFDRNYMKLMLPIYIRKSRHLFPISQFAVDENRKYLHLPLDNVTVTYAAPKPCFRRINDPQILNEIRAKYTLPSKFVLAVTRVDHPGLDKSNSFFPGKNVDTTVRAFMQLRERFPHRLVVAGLREKEYLLARGFREDDLEGIDFKGFVPHEELPAILSLADVFVLPSFYESYAMAMVEAMACGCPVVAATTGACPEIAGDAALLADPNDPTDFAAQISEILGDPERQHRMRTLSLERARGFASERAAELVLGEMARVVGTARHR